jgi:hypothetical protein
LQHKVFDNNNINDREIHERKSDKWKRIKDRKNLQAAPVTVTVSGKSPANN